MAIKVSFNLFIWLLLVHFNFLTPLSFLSSSHKLQYIHPTFILMLTRILLNFRLTFEKKKHLSRVCYYSVSRRYKKANCQCFFLNEPFSLAY